MNGLDVERRASPFAKAGHKTRNPHTRPSDVFRRSVREMRKRRGWRIRDLADRVGLDRTAMVRIENGDRRVSLDEAIAISTALGASPTHLLAPPNGPSLQVAPGEAIDARRFRAWLAGRAWVRPDDTDYMPAEVDDDAWGRRLETSMSLVFHRHQQLLDALEPFIPPESEAAAAAHEALQAAQNSLDEFARAVVDRSNPRPLARHRVRRVG